MNLKLSNQEADIYWQIRRLGGRITTNELMGMRISQYQARLKSLREKLAKENITLTEAESNINDSKNFMYRLITPGQQMELI